MSRPFLKKAPPTLQPYSLIPFALGGALSMIRDATTPDEVASCLDTLIPLIRAGHIAVRPSLVRCDDSPVAVGLRLDLARAEDL